MDTVFETLILMGDKGINKLQDNVVNATILVFFSLNNIFWREYVKWSVSQTSKI